MKIIEKCENVSSIVQPGLRFVFMLYETKLIFMVEWTNRVFMFFAGMLRLHSFHLNN